MRYLPYAVHALLILATASAAAQSNDRTYSNTPVAGGGGGSDFQATCPGKTKLIGIGGRTGEWVDAMHPICGYWDQRLRDFHPIPDGPQAGGKGGGPAEVRCPPKMAVGGWEIAQVHHGRSDLVQYVTLLCVASTSSAAKTVAMARYGGHAPAARANVFRYRCPAMMLANGIYGRSGAYIDNAGLECTKTGDLFPLPGR